MTVAARISQADMARVTKSVKAAGFDHPRFEFDFANQKIIVTTGQPGEPTPAANPWDEDDEKA